MKKRIQHPRRLTVKSRKSGIAQKNCIGKSCSFTEEGKVAECPFHCCYCDEGISACDLESLLSAYKEKYHEQMKMYLELYRDDGLSFNKCIIAAATARCPQSPDKKHPHQSRISNQALKDFSRKLKTLATKLQENQKKSFDDLLVLITGAKVPGIGALTCYDTALRIGASLNVLPKKTIYLHAGAVIPNWRKAEIAKSQLCDDFKKMEAYEIEDFLCRFHRILEKQEWRLFKDLKQQKRKP